MGPRGDSELQELRKEMWKGRNWKHTMTSNNSKTDTTTIIPKIAICIYSTFSSKDILWDSILYITKGINDLTMLTVMSASMNFTRVRPDLEPSPGPGLLPSIDNTSGETKKWQANMNVTGNPQHVLKLIFMDNSEYCHLIIILFSKWLSKQLCKLKIVFEGTWPLTPSCSINTTFYLVSLLEGIKRIYMK